MKKESKTIIFFSLLMFFPFGIFLRYNEIPGFALSMFVGFSTVLVTLTFEVLKQSRKHKSSLLELFNLTLIAIMTFILFSKYFHQSIGDYLGLLIIPLFIISAIHYLVSSKKRNARILTINILYIALSIPLFAFNYFNGPRNFFPDEWLGVYHDVIPIEIEIPIDIDDRKAQIIFEKGLEQLKKDQYSNSIRIFKEALTIEENNPKILFYLAESYAKNEELELAIAVLDTAIRIDNSFYGFYNNRGFFHCKIRSYKKAINDFKLALNLKPNDPLIHMNLAVAYYYEDQYKKACDAIQKASSLGFDLDGSEDWQRIMERSCK